jgi:hypothetical protein
MGLQRQRARPKGEWLTREDENLRIVSDVLWAAAQRRITRTRTTIPTADASRAIARRDVDSKYLLSGTAAARRSAGR